MEPLRPRLLRVDPAREDAAILVEAVEVLGGGGLVAYPTETFYGLGCDPFSEAAVARLVEAKGRPADRPLPLLVGGLEQLPAVVASFPGLFAEIVDRFWPGPLTLVLPAAGGLAAPVTAGGGTVAVRWTSGRVAARLASAFGRALVGTSANRSGRPPSQTAAQARADLDRHLDLILDAGPAPGGLPSTLLDLTCRPPRLLREGAVPRQRLEPWLE